MHGEVAAVLQVTARELGTFLGRVLPAVSDDWWERLVRPTLKHGQHAHLRRSNEVSLASLDLSALLRVLDANWHLVSTHENMAVEARHYAKELQSIRNRWAHADTLEVASEDLYRDLDTIQRFCSAIQASVETVERVRSLKRERCPGIAPSAESGGILDAPRERHRDWFQPGDLVTLSSDRSARGVVAKVIEGEQARYSVMLDGKLRTFYATQLMAVEPSGETESLVSLDAFHAHLTAQQVSHPGLSSLYSLNAAKIEFVPYQFRPVLKFIRADRPRLLIADSVGVGKTIEAGLILRELQARREVQQVLIVCPKPLVAERKWQLEMRRFDEEFTHLDGPAFWHCLEEAHLDGAWPSSHAKVIVPYSLFDQETLYGRKKNRRIRGLLQLSPPPRFDLVIVDEAHHIRNTDTYAYEAVRFLCDNADAVLFLTATPIQLHDRDLYVLLNTLRPDLIIDPSVFERMSEPNPHIHQAAKLVRLHPQGWQSDALEALRRAAHTPWGKSVLSRHPGFLMACSALEAGLASEEERVALVRTIEEQHSFAGIINRTRRRDIGDFTTRKPETVTVNFTSEQREIHDRILSIQEKTLARLHGAQSVKFLMTNIRRRAASCLFGLAPFLKSILSRHLDELDEAEVDEEGLGAVSAEGVRWEIEEILSLVHNLDPYDPKLEALRTIIDQKRNLPNNKLMVFSSFRHTLAYLLEQLQASGYRVGVVHGATPLENRDMLRRRFELRRDEDEALDVLLFSEVGTEGLDYQFCDCLANYDLPWNPMKVEQRIGRLDRKGQMSKALPIYNFITPGTVDADIYTRCLLRIGIFDRALGDNEEILGRIARQVRNVAESFELTQEEQHGRLDQIAANEIRLLQEEQQLEERQSELFGIRAPLQQMEQEVQDATSFWLSPHSLENLVKDYLNARCGERQEYLQGDKARKTLRLSQDAKALLLSDHQAMMPSISLMHREWRQWLVGGDQYLAVTFEAECARNETKVVLLSPVHPLVRQAAGSRAKDEALHTAVWVQTDDIPPGDYPFAVYQWQYQGIQEDVRLEIVCRSAEVASRLPYLLQLCKSFEPEDASYPSPDVFALLDGNHYNRWLHAVVLHKEKTRQLIEFRMESLRTSHAARLALLQEQLEKATNERIYAMKAAQIRAAEADHDKQIAKFDKALRGADIEAQTVAFGLLRVVTS